MKIMESYSRVSITKHIAAFFSTKSSAGGFKMPALVVYVRQGSGMDRLEDHQGSFGILKIRTRLAKQKLTELIQKHNELKKNNSGLVGNEAKLALFLVEVSKIKPAREDDFYNYESISVQFPELFTREIVSNRSELIYRLTVHYSMPISIWDAYFGARPDDGELGSRDNQILIHNAKVDFPDDLKPKTRKIATDLMGTIYTILHKHNLGELYNDISYLFLRTLPGRVVGDYDVATETMRIQISNKYSEDVLRTVAHEFGHAYFKKIRNGLPPILPVKYMELRKTFKFTRKVSDSNTEIIDLIRKQIKIGSILTYLGRKDFFKKVGTWTISKIEPKGNSEVIHIRPVDSEKWGPRMAAWGPPGFLASKHWQIDGKSFPIETASRSTFNDSVDLWFPTSYSYEAIPIHKPNAIKHNAEEWFCELFSLYLVDKLHGEPADFIKSIIGT